MIHAWGQPGRQIKQFKSDFPSFIPFHSLPFRSIPFLSFNFKSMAQYIYCHFMPNRVQGPGVLKNVRVLNLHSRIFTNSSGRHALKSARQVTSSERISFDAGSCGPSCGRNAVRLYTMLGCWDMDIMLVVLCQSVIKRDPSLGWIKQCKFWGVTP